MKGKWAIACLCLLASVRAAGADPALSITDGSKDSRLFDTPYVTLQAPSGLLYRANPSGSSLRFEASARQSMAGFGVAVSSLQSVKGYKTKWNDLPGYFEFIRQPFRKEKVGPYEWAYLETQGGAIIDKTFFTIHEGRWVQAGYRYPASAQEEYGAMFEGMPASIRLKR